MDTNEHEHVIEVTDLRRVYGGGFEAVCGISFRVDRGQVFALLGTNGAGKTSTVELLEGLARPTGGRVRVLGHDPYAERAVVRPRTGVMLQEGGFPSELTVAETARMRAGCVSGARPPGEALALVGLEGKAGVRVKQLSGGERRRLDLALALLGSPEVLFLDEPTTGLDAEGRRDTWELVRALRDGGTTVLLTTHYLEEAEDLADRLAILHEGRIAAAGTPAEVTAAQPSRISFELRDGLRYGLRCGLGYGRFGAGRAAGAARRRGRDAGGGAGRRRVVPAGRGGAVEHGRNARGHGMTTPVRLLLADDEHLIRGAMAALLSLEDDLVIMAEAATGPEALAMARAHAPDVAVLDLQMPGADGVKVATSLRAELPDCRVLIVTSHGRPGHLKRALEAGVRGFVLKTVSAQRLAEIIRTVHAGNRYVDPELAADAISAGDSPLTAREAEVLEFAADGAPVAEIAERAALSQGTVRNYLSSAVSKLGAENRHAAVRLARERGWV